MLNTWKRSTLAAAISIAIGTVVVLAMESGDSEPAKQSEDLSIRLPSSDAVTATQNETPDTQSRVETQVALEPVAEAPKEVAVAPIVEAEAPDADEDIDYRAWAPGYTEFGAQQPSAEELAALREQRRQRIRAHFDSRLEQEPADAKWQAEVSQRANRAIGMLPLLEQSSIEGTQCGATLCRLSVLASDEKALRELRQLYAGVGLVLGSDAWAFTDEGQFKTHIYVSRPGSKLPPMQASSP